MPPGLVEITRSTNVDGMTIAFFEYSPNSAVSHHKLGLFVPKPSRRIDCQRRIVPDLGAIVRQLLLAAAAGGGDCYSLGYSARGSPRLGHLNANYWRGPASDRTVQPGAYVDACTGQPQGAQVAVPGCCTERRLPAKCPSSVSWRRCLSVPTDEHPTRDKPGHHERYPERNSDLALFTLSHDHKIHLDCGIGLQAPGEDHLTLLCLSRTSGKIHRPGELPVELAGDVSLRQRRISRTVFPSAVRRAT
jgi:hypothetical protein